MNKDHVYHDDCLRSPLQQEPVRRKIAQQVREFESRGGVITTLPLGMTPAQRRALGIRTRWVNA